MKRILYFYGGSPHHKTQWAGEQLEKLLKANGDYQMDMTEDLDALAKLPQSEYDTVVLYATGHLNELTPPREKGLLDFVHNGGGFVGIHAAADCFRGNPRFIELLGSEFYDHPEHHEFTINIAKTEHYITTRMEDFAVYDEMYHLQKFDPAQCTVLASTKWQGKDMPMVYAREVGKGRQVYLANGHTDESWNHPGFQKLVVRSVAWASGANSTEKTIRCGVLGFGPFFGMGQYHLDSINNTPGLQAVAMCDASKERVEAAKKEYPDLSGHYNSLDEMLAADNIDLIVDVLPHNLHAPTALQCLRAGKHVVLEKPFCLTVEEANSMVDTAREQNVMLSLFHNRRWDGDYMAIKKIIAKGLIGEVFHIEATANQYNHPRFWWRSDKKVSGGLFYDWGAHVVDWILNLVPSELTQVMGDLQKRVWNSVTNEDHGCINMRFANGVTAQFMISNIAALSGPGWRILGTKGALQEQEGGRIDYVSHVRDIREEGHVKIDLTSEGAKYYYRNIADHLLFGEDLIVKPEQARRVIAVIEAAQDSAKAGRSLPVAPGCE